MTNHSYWLDSTPTKEYPQVTNEIKTNVVIVGAGMTGILTAYLLSNYSDLDIVLVDSDKVFHGASGYTTAKITAQHHIIYNKLIHYFGEEQTKLYASANYKAVDFIEKLIRELNINCNFTRLPSFVYTQKNSFKQLLEKEANALDRIGLDCNLIESLNLPLETICGIKLDNQAQFHPTLFLSKILEQLESTKVRIFENTTIIDLKEAKKCALLTSTNNYIAAEKVIITSHYPFYDGLSFYFSRLIPKKSYIVASKLDTNIPEGMFISAENPIRSFRTTDYNNQKMLLVGGDNHFTGHGTDLISHYESLTSFSRDVFQTSDVLYKWSTEDYGTLDGIPYVGKLNKTSTNVYVATGYNKWGMTNSVVASQLLTDTILEKENPLTDLYSPSRVSILASTKNFVTHNVDVGFQYLKSKLTFSDPEKEVDYTEAKIVNIAGKQYGAYIDENNEVFILDITCPHMGCELKWNNADLTWDCPCHGSRFNYKGEVITGPAHSPLSQYNETSNVIDPNIVTDSENFKDDKNDE